MPARAARELLLCGVFSPLVSAYARRTVSGLENLPAGRAPVVLVANHQSHVDTPVLLGSVPAHRRRRTAVAAAADYFYGSRMLATAVSLTFGTVPIQRRADGDESSLAGLQRLIGQGWTLVLFAEGTRSRTGRVGELRTGAAVLSAHAGAPIVPVRISGTAATMPPGCRWMRRPAGPGASRRHPVSVRFGSPINALPGDDPLAIMERVRCFLQVQEPRSLVCEPV